MRNRTQALAEKSQTCANKVRKISPLAAWPFTRISNERPPISSDVWEEVVTCTVTVCCHLMLTIQTLGETV